MRIAEAKSGHLYLVKVNRPSEEERYELHLGVGWAEVRWDDRGNLVANLPAEVPELLVERRGKDGGVMSVSWIAYDRPSKEGERRFLTVRVKGFRSLELDVDYLESHPNGRRMEPFDAERALTQARRSFAYRIQDWKAKRTGQNVGYTHLVWPGANVCINGVGRRSSASFSQPWSPAHLPKEGPKGTDHVMVIEAHWKSEEQPYVIVEDRQGNQTRVDPLDLIEDLHGGKLDGWRSKQVDESTKDLQRNVRSILNSLAPDLNAGHGGSWVTETGVFLPWEAIKAILIDGHEAAGEALGKLAEAALTIEHERELTP